MPKLLEDYSVKNKAVVVLLKILAMGEKRFGGPFFVFRARGAGFIPRFSRSRLTNWTICWISASAGTRTANEIPPWFLWRAFLFSILFFFVVVRTDHASA
jgi:hypothetical protein